MFFWMQGNVLNFNEYTILKNKLRSSHTRLFKKMHTPNWNCLLELKSVENYKNTQTKNSVKLWNCEIPDFILENELIQHTESKNSKEEKGLRPPFVPLTITIQ